MTECERRVLLPRQVVTEEQLEALLRSDNPDWTQKTCEDKVRTMSNRLQGVASGHIDFPLERG